MTGIDTNVLVRYLTRDDAAQYRKAKSFLEEICTDENPGYLHSIVLCELVWVLGSAYKATKNEIVSVLEQLLLTRQFDVADREAVRDALEMFKVSTADFSDCLVGRMNRLAGCGETATFDEKASTLDTFRGL